MDPHSTIFFSSHLSDTGFVKKSLHPAAKASTRSDDSEDAVRATMMTDDRNGDVGSSLDGDGVRTISDVGVDGKTPMLWCFSSRRISRVASVPFITGSWISICSENQKEGKSSVTELSRKEGRE